MRKEQTTERIRNDRSPGSVTDSLEERRITEAMAYQLWLQRGCPIGSDEDDWYEAERQLGQLRSADTQAA